MDLQEDRKNKKGYQPVVPERDSRNHNHTFMAMADVSNRHQHLIVGTTSPAMYSNRTHVHRIYVRTSFDPKETEGHWHMVEETTGPAIEVPGGEHTHYFRGETSYDLGHRHCFDNITASAPDSDYDDCDNHHHDDDDC
ncbi:YmaF family protein [Dendrosporobacter sp. 1207_IL3150]|uniref:YmaF family protein n=1 Tax=Dendrosporobacter sp. 1207_IL3150 TaxID=3084054 RepID=UPI002FDAD5DC